MGQFLNNKEPYDKYKTVMNGTFFVDKTEILKELIPALQQEQRFFCITRPRRFGKTVMANMIAAFFEKNSEKSLFEKLAIAQYDQYKEQAGCHDVIYIDFSEMPRECHSYEEYIGRIQDGLVRDINEAYPEIAIDKNEAVWDVLSQVFDKTGHKFIFVMDEWDAVFQMSFVTERDRENYLLFLKLLLKGKSYVELAYMTGVLPIAKYSDGSELNMFWNTIWQQEFGLVNILALQRVKLTDCTSAIWSKQKSHRLHAQISGNGMMDITLHQEKDYTIHVR